MTISASVPVNLIDDADLPCLRMSRCSTLPYRRRTISYHLILPSRDVIFSALTCAAPLPVSSLKTTGVAERFSQPRGEMDRPGSGHAIVSDPRLRSVQSEHVSVHPRPTSAVRRMQSLSASHRH